MITPNPADDVEKLIRSYTDSADFKWHSHVAIFYEAKYVFTKRSSKCTLWAFILEYGNVHPYKTCT